MELLFITFGFADFVDILLVAIILYQLYKLVRGTVAMNIFVGLMLLYLVWLTVKFLNLSLLSTILDSFISVGVIAVIILFQQEIRKFLLLLGNTDSVKKRFSLTRLLDKADSVTISANTLHEICRACRDMSKTKTGALIVLSRNSELTTYVQSGDTLNADVSHRMIESVFFKNSPMHDGAMIIVGNQIKAARCVLPVNDDLVLPPHLGLRHRAALSMSNETETAIVVVSEETGSISFIRAGDIKYDITIETLLTQLHNFATNGQTSN
jgi:uncharacterized protein (TIGR00159 family)